MIRWIIPDRLASGPALTAHYPGAKRVDVRDLVDAAGNSTTAVAEKIAEGVSTLANGGAVLVVCDFGVSRSNAVAAGILARWQGISFDRALATVIEQTGEREIKLSMVATVRDALAQNTGAKSGARTFVTGATGFVGRHVIDAFGEDVAPAPGRDTFDLRGSPALLAAHLAKAEVGCVVHMAHPRIYTNNTALGEALTMQQNLMDAALAVGARFVLASCSAVFAGQSGCDRPLPPSTPRKPRGVFGATKSLQEELLAMAAENSGLEARIVRFAQTYGPGGLRPRLIQSFAAAIMAGRPVVTHRFEDGPSMIELLHIEDAARGIVEIARRGAQPVYHLGSEDFLSPAEIAQRIATHLGRSLIVEDMDIAGRADRVRLDWASTSGEIGWRPRISFDAGLADTLESLRAEGRLC